MTDLAAKGPRSRADRPEPAPAGPPPVPLAGVELSRLLARAQLTLAQALELSAGVATEAQRRSQPSATGPDREQIPLGPVAIGADGRVVPGPAAGAAHDGRQPASGPSLGAVLADVAGAVRPRAGSAGPAAEQLLAEIDGAIAELPVCGVAATAHRLEGVAAALDRAAVRAELGALVRAIGAPAPPGAVGPAASTPATGRQRRPDSTGRSPATRRVVAWLLSGLLLVGAVVGEVAVLGDHITGDVGALLAAGRSGSTSSAARKSDGLPIAAPAPASAGPVTGVDLRTLALCAASSPCTVRLSVRVTAAAGQQAVTWSFRVVDRCTGASAQVPGGSVTLPAGATEATAVTTLPLPAAPGLALIAVTQAPAAAASPPVLVGTCTATPAAR